MHPDDNSSPGMELPPADFLTDPRTHWREYSAPFLEAAKRAEKRDAPALYEIANAIVQLAACLEGHGEPDPSAIDRDAFDVHEILTRRASVR